MILRYIHINCDFDGLMPLHATRASTACVARHYLGVTAANEALEKTRGGRGQFSEGRVDLRRGHRAGFGPDHGRLGGEAARPRGLVDQAQPAGCNRFSGIAGRHVCCSPGKASGRRGGWLEDGYCRVSDGSWVLR